MSKGRKVGLLALLGTCLLLSGCGGFDDGGFFFFFEPLNGGMGFIEEFFFF